ncbi:MAG: sulfite exporter TauE/SafE family protein, partial [Psychroflexus sp.]
MLWSAFIFGLLGSLHCVGMCGPIALMLPVDRQNETRKFFQIFLYHLGRISTYALIGLFFGLIGESFAMFGFQQQLSIIIGVLMLLSVILPQSALNKIRITKPIYRIIGNIKSEIGQSLKKKELDTFFYLGFLNGFLPCGLVYMAVFASVAVSGLM